MPTRIKDYRNDIRTLEQARTHFDDMVVKILDMEYRNARFEKRVAAMKQQHESNTAAVRAEIELAETQLCDFITTHPELFQKPRTIKTNSGEFGKRHVEELKITDETECLKTCKRRGYVECFKEVTSLIKKALKRHLKAGDKITGCTLKEGDTATYKVASTLLEDSRRRAET